MRETCPTCLGHGFVYALDTVLAPPKPRPEETEEKPKRPIIRGINGNLTHLRRL